MSRPPHEGAGRRPRLPENRQVSASCAGLVGSPIAPEIDQAEFADLHLIAVAQQGFVDEVLVDVGAVETSYVPDDGPSGVRVNVACRRDTEMSSRKMSES